MNNRQEDALAAEHLWYPRGLGVVMFEVTVGIADRADLSEQMEAMRTWLDQRRFEPKIFRYRYLSKAVIFKVTFSVEREAAEFARAFDGALTSGSPLVI